MTVTVESFTVELDTGFEHEWEWEDAVAEFSFELEAIAPYLYIDGQNMGWTRQSGFAVVASEDWLKAFSVNGDYRLVLKVHDGTPYTWKIVRYSHDEPTGASFTIRRATNKEIMDYA